MIEAEQHPLKPFLPHNARLLMLGSFPPQKKRWSMDFFYPNMQNDMWRIFGVIFFENKDYFLRADKKAFDQRLIEKFLTDKGVAIFDTASSIKRLKDNASDNFLEVVEETDVESLLDQIPACRTIVTTGQKATDVLCFRFHLIEAPTVGGFSNFIYKGRDMRLYRMPSSSRAYPLPLAQKAEKYRILFEYLEMI